MSPSHRRSTGSCHRARCRSTARLSYLDASVVEVVLGELEHVLLPLGRTLAPRHLFAVRRATQADTLFTTRNQRPPRPGLLVRALAPVVVLLQAGGALHGVVRRHATTIRAAICTKYVLRIAVLENGAAALRAVLGWYRPSVGVPRDVGPRRVLFS
jgi:hypothetical protein